MKPWRDPYTYALIGWLHEWELIDKAARVTEANDPEMARFTCWLLQNECQPEIVQNANLVEVALWLHG